MGSAAMEAWLLFATGACGGEARRLREVGEPSFGAHAKRLSLQLENRDGNQLRESAELGAARAYDILWKEKLLERSVDLTFRGDGEEPKLVLGHSCDLAFALAFVVATLSSFKGWVFPALAASGVLDDAGGVQPVDGLPGKLDAALRVISEGGLIFYPSANDGDIAPEVRLRARTRKIELRPVERLDEAIAALGVRLERVYLDSPFRGLEAFEYRHRSIYFGRRAESKALVARLIAREQAGRPGVLVIGASGSGKSSFVQAGVLPELEYWAGRSQIGLDWTLWRPREAGVTGADEAMLVASILQSWRRVPDLAQLADQTALGTLADAYTQAWPAARKFVWVIDQLEELFTLGFDAGLVDRFADLLLALQQRGAWVLGTLRADFYPEYQRHAILVAAYSGDGLFNLLELAGENLRQVIEVPAEAAGYGFEEDGSGVSLATRLLKEAQDATDPLPLLQLGLAELYRHRDEDRRLLTWDAYRKIGGSEEGLKGAVGKHAETHFSRLPEDVQAALPRLLRALVAIGPKSAPIARPAERALLTRDPSTSQLVEALLDPQVRLLAAEGDAASTRIRVAHEAVFTHWDHARALIEQNWADIQLAERICADAAAWGKEGNDDLLIPAGLRLTQAEDLWQRLGDELEPDVAKFIEVSVAAETRRREEAAAREAAIERERTERLEEKARAAQDTARLAQEKAESETKLRRRTQRAAWALAALLLLTGGIGILLYRSQQIATANEDRAKANEERAIANEERAKANQERARANEERAIANEERAKTNQERAKANEERAKKNEEHAIAATRESERRLARITASRSLEKLAAGDTVSAREFAAESARLWQDDEGRPDPEAGYAIARSALVKPVAVTAEARRGGLKEVISRSDGIWGGQGFVFADSGMRVALISRDLQSLSVLTPEAGYVVDSAFSENGSVLLLNSEGGIQEFGTAEGLELWNDALKLSGERIRPELQSCHRTYCAAIYTAQAASAYVYILSLVDRKIETRRIKLPFDNTELPQLRLQLFGRNLAVMGKNGSTKGSTSLAIYRLVDAENSDTTLGATRTIDDVIDFQFMGEDKLIVISASNLVELIDLVPYRRLSLGSIGARHKRLAVNADSDVASIICEDGSLVVVDRQSLFTLPARDSPTFRTYSVRGLTVLLVVSDDGWAEVVNYITGERFLLWRGTPFDVRAATYQSETDRLLLLSDDGDLYAWELTFAEPNRRDSKTKSKQDFDALGRGVRSGQQRLAQRSVEFSVHSLDDTTLGAVDPIFVNGSSDLAVLNTHSGIWVFQHGKLAHVAAAPEVARRVVQSGTNKLAILSTTQIHLLKFPPLSGSSLETKSMQLTERAEKLDSRFESLSARDDGRVLVATARNVYVIAPEFQEIEISAKLDQAIDGLQEISDFWWEAQFRSLAILTTDCVLRRVHVDTGRLITTMRRPCN